MRSSVVLVTCLPERQEGGVAQVGHRGARCLGRIREVHGRDGVLRPFTLTSVELAHALS